MTEIINQIKQALEYAGSLPWRHVELETDIDYDVIHNSNGNTVLGIQSYTQENVDFLLLAVNNISSLITTIESQKEEIERLQKPALSLAYRVLKEKHEHDAESYIEHINGLESQIESLKAITELAVKEKEQLIKRNVPDMTDLSNLAYINLSQMWSFHGSAYLINVLRHMDYQNDIPDIFSPERFSPSAKGDSHAQT